MDIGTLLLTTVFVFAVERVLTFLFDYFKGKRKSKQRKRIK